VRLYIKDAIGRSTEITVTLSELKALIRDAESKGFRRTSKHWSNFINETRIAGGIPLVKSTCSDYEAIAIYVQQDGAL